MRDSMMFFLHMIRCLGRQMVNESAAWFRLGIQGSVKQVVTRRWAIYKQYVVTYFVALTEWAKLQHF